MDAGKREIMEATHSAVKNHGYSDLTMQHIADEFDRSKSLLYYHYTGREQLLADFLGYILDSFLADLPTEETTPQKELQELIDRLLPAKTTEEPYRLALAMFELRMNAPHNQAVRQQYVAVEEELKRLLEDMLQRGIEVGEFVDMDIAVEAEGLLSLLIGTRARRLTVYDPDESIEPMKTAINSHIDRLSATSS
jgi:AcrR family transcriptional regulator